MPIKIISLNVDSIVSTTRKTLLTDFINSTRADIYLFQETKLSSNIKLHFPLYNIIRCDVRKGYGGTAIFIRNGLSFRNPTYSNGKINFTSIQIKIDNNWFRISSVYVTHGHRDILTAFQAIFNTNNHILFGGDFNSRHPNFGDHSENAYGTHLHSCIQPYNLNITNPPYPTCYHSTLGSFIDKFISINFLPISNISNIPSFSDHSAITIHIPCNPQPSPPPKRINNYHLTHLKPFNQFIDLRLKGLNLDPTIQQTPAQLDQITEKIDNIFRSAIDQIVRKSSTPNNVITLSNSTRSLQNESKRLQRLLFRSNGILNPQFTQSIKTRISLLKIMIRNAVNSEVSTYFNNLYDRVENTRDAFKLIKNFTSLKSKSNTSSGIFSDDTKIILLNDPKAICNAFGELFSSVHSLTSTNPTNNQQIPIPQSISTHSAATQISINIDNIIINNHIDPIPISNLVRCDILNEIQLTAIDNSLPLHQRNLLTHAEEVSTIISSRPNKKSSGHDQMPFFLIKQFCPSIILFLVTLFNQCLASSHFPASWKHATVTSIPKIGKDSSILSNWRPISLLNCISKIFEKILMNRVNREIPHMNILQNQFGFLTGVSSEHALALLQANINTGLNNKQITSIVAIDLKSAFDVVWHDGLIHKLCKLGLNPIIIKTIKNFLTNRSFSVRLGDTISRSYSMTAGVPQGSVSGPTLFNLYLHDLPSHPFLKCLQFADDTTFYISHSDPPFAQNVLNTFLITLSTYLEKWKLILNENKTEFINILGMARDTNPKLRRLARNMRITLKGNVIKHSSNIRLLGMHLQCNNRFIKHIDNRLSKAKISKFHLNRIFKRYKMPINIKCNIYKIYIRPILSYASPIWCRQPNVSSHQMERLRVFERSILRSATNSHRDRGSYKYINSKYLYNKANCLRIDRFMALRHLKFYNNIHNSNTPKLKNIILHQNENGPYETIDALLLHHNHGNLVINDQFALFNTRYNQEPGLVYSLNQ